MYIYIYWTWQITLKVSHCAYHKCINFLNCIFIL